MNQENKGLIGRVSILVATLIWGSSFVVLKTTLDTVPTFYILAFRFTIGAVLLFLASLKKLKTIDKKYWIGGVMMGCCLFGAYTAQTFGLERTTPGKNAFLTAAYCVMVPFFNWLFYKKRPDRYNLSAAIICVIGMGFVSLTGDFTINLGDALTILGSVFYALHILATARAVEGRSAVLLTMLQFATVAVLCWISALLFQEFPMNMAGGNYLSIAYLGVMCTTGALLLQTIGQKFTPPAAASVLLTLESVFGVIISVIFYHEQMTLRLVLGFDLIFAAVLISETKLSFLLKTKQEEPHV